MSGTNSELNHLLPHGLPNLQALEVQLIKPTSELFTQKIVEFLMSCSEPEEEEGLSKRFLMKVVRDNPVPDVELFVRIPDNNELVAVNDIIGMCYEDYRRVSLNFHRCCSS